MNNAITKGYSLALYEYSIEKKVNSKITDDLILLSEVLTKDYNDIFRDPDIAKKEKLTNINKISKAAKLCKITSNFLEILIKNNIFYYILDIIKEYHVICSLNAKKIVGVITLNNKLVQSDIQKITKHFSKIVKKNIVFVQKIDKSIVGGFIVEVNRKVYDYTYKSRLKKMKQKMLEIHLEGK